MEQYRGKLSLHEGISKSRLSVQSVGWEQRILNTCYLPVLGLERFGGFWVYESILIILL